VRCGRGDMLRVVLELGFDPDESGVLEGIDDVVPKWGDPLRECAIAGDVELAEILLEHGANPNANVYAASSALYEAQTRGHAELAALFRQLGEIFDRHPASLAACNFLQLVPREAGKQGDQGEHRGPQVIEEKRSGTNGNERRATLNLRVDGSIPSRLTFFPNNPANRDSLHGGVRRLTH
jgi:hypothetical protein